MKQPIDTSRPKSTPCPTQECLIAFLSASQPIDQGLADHLETCVECQAALDSLSDSSPLNELRKLGSDQEWTQRLVDTDDTGQSTSIAIANARTDVLAPDTQRAVASGATDYEGPGHEMLGRMLGQYKIERLLGWGGMGAVYEATDTLLNRNIALKVMRPDKAAKDEYQSRFAREARAAAKLTHDNICPVYQVGEVDGLVFITMPLLAGETLEHRMQRQLPSLHESVEIVRQAAEALHAAHHVGLVHRDIKPANIWLEPHPQSGFRVRILDFGLARFQSDDHNVTHSGTILGTPPYMAPEQARGETVDSQADLFSLGAVFYELATGNKAFPGNSAMSILSNVLTFDPPPVSQVDSGIPESLSQIIASLLEKDRSKRTLDTHTLLQQLKRFQAENVIAPGQQDPRPATARSRQIEIDTLETSEHFRVRSSPRFGRRARVWGLVAMLFMATTVFAGRMLFQTPTGTLVVEFDDSVDIRVNQGVINIHDESGALRYTLKPEQNESKLAAGMYRVSVTGADGLQVSTDAFEMKQGEEVVIRVTASAPSLELPDKPEVAQSTPNNSAVENSTPDNSSLAGITFPGKTLISTDFSDPQLSQLPLGEFGNGVQILNSTMEGGVYRCTLQAKNFNEKLAFPIANECRAAALMMRCRSLNGNLFFNFGTTKDGKTTRFFSIAVRRGTWHLYHVEQRLEDGKWVPKITDSLASESVVNTRLMDGKWVNFAAKWNQRDYSVWLNNELIASGPLPAEQLTSPVQMNQVCVHGSAPGNVAVELSHLQLIDQSDVPPENTHPVGLPH